MVLGELPRHILVGYAGPTQAGERNVKLIRVHDLNTPLLVSVHSSPLVPSLIYCLVSRSDIFSALNTFLFIYPSAWHYRASSTWYYSQDPQLGIASAQPLGIPRQ